MHDSHAGTEFIFTGHFCRIQLALLSLYEYCLHMLKRYVDNTINAFRWDGVTRFPLNELIVSGYAV